ncbi:MAG: hypothetical protein U0324_36840 [Polyangiales bacterium]
MILWRLRVRGGDPFEIADTRADLASALLVARAAERKTFGDGASVVAIDAIARAQLAHEGWVLCVPPEALAPLTVAVMAAAASGLSIGHLGIAATLAARLDAVRGARERLDVESYVAG